jgi:hypothetical protein
LQRRNFIKALLGLAAAPLAIAVPKSQSEGEKSQSYANAGEFRDITLSMRLRALEARMVANNVQPFPDELYHGEIGLSTARQLLDDGLPLRDGDEFQFAGFRLRVSDDGFGGVSAWGRP